MTTVRALVVSDQESKYLWDYFDKKNFPGIEVIISCGDLKANYLSFLTTMLSAPLLYVPGNHDGNYLRQPPEGCDDLTEKIHTIKGIRFLGMGGANSMSPKAFHYSEREVAKQVIKRMPEICSQGGFDVLVTHAPAAGLGDGEDSFHKGFLAYRALLTQFEPAFHLHGHQHMNYGGAKRELLHGKTRVLNGFGYRVVDLEVRRGKRKRLSYIMTRYSWGKIYGNKLQASRKA